MADKYRYRLISTKCSSERLGKCVVCGKEVADVHLQVEEKEYFSKTKQRISFTQLNCSRLFGHKECLISKQKVA